MMKMRNEFKFDSMLLKMFIRIGKFGSYLIDLGEYLNTNLFSSLSMRY